MDNPDVKSPLCVTFIAEVFLFIIYGAVLTLATAWKISESYPNGLSLLMCIIIFAIQIVFITVIDEEWHSGFSGSTIFIVYTLFAALEGAILSIAFEWFRVNVILSIFASCMAYFLGLTIVGLCCSFDSTRLERILYKILVGLVIAGIVNWFVASDLVDMLTTMIALPLFTVYTVTETKNLKYVPEGKRTPRHAISHALSLYLIFMNIFVSVLKIKKRNN